MPEALPRSNHDAAAPPFGSGVGSSLLSLDLGSPATVLQNRVQRGAEAAYSASVMLLRGGGSNFRANAPRASYTRFLRCYGKWFSWGFTPMP